MAVHKNIPESLQQTLQRVIQHLIELTQNEFDSNLIQCQASALKEKIDGYVSRKRGSHDVYEEALLPALKRFNEQRSTAKIRELESKLNEIKRTQSYAPKLGNHQVINNILQTIIDAWLSVKQIDTALVLDLQVHSSIQLT
jgi:hypothetical protein